VTAAGIAAVRRHSEAVKAVSPAVMPVPLPAPDRMILIQGHLSTVAEFGRDGSVMVAGK
jgi:hypothetical protein